MKNIINWFSRMSYRIKDTYQTTKHFFRNIWVFRKTLLYHRRWDYNGILQSMHDALDDMIKYNMPHVHNGQKHVEDMKIARELCKRLIEDDVLTHKFTYEMKSLETDERGFTGVEITAKPIFDFPTKPNYRLNYQKQYLELLTSILNRKLRHWWD